MSYKIISTEALIAKFQQALGEKWGYIWGAAGILWTAAKQQQKIDYMIKKYGTNWKNSEAAKKDNYYSAAVYGAKWIGHTVADCSGLFDWAFRVLGGLDIYHGSNTIWDKYCTSKGELKKGKRDDGKELKPGTAIFTHNANTGKRGHIGLYIGDGWVIEASGTINGVIKSKITISKWVEWGELKGVDYENGIQDVITNPEENKTYGTIRKGDKGPVVKYAQQLLLDRGYKLPKYGADGDYGNETVAAVKAFQKDWGLKQDGIIGPMTWEKLRSTPEAPEKPAEPEKTYTVTVKGLTRAQAEELTGRYPGSNMKEEER